jgi:hypothetical protein
MWDQTRSALEFFQNHLPLAQMTSRDDLVQGGQAWCLAKPGTIYAVYRLAGDELRLHLEDGRYRVSWFDPRHGGPLQDGVELTGPGPAALGQPPRDPPQDWAAVIRRID